MVSVNAPGWAPGHAGVGKILLVRTGRRGPGDERAPGRPLREGRSYGSVRENSGVDLDLRGYGRPSQVLSGGGSVGGGGGVGRGRGVGRGSQGEEDEPAGVEEAEDRGGGGVAQGEIGDA